MIEFSFQGISVEAVVEMEPKDYKDANQHLRTRFDRNQRVIVRFWDFTINDSLHELAFIKSTLNYFMQSYWKRSSRKDGGKINLEKELQRADPYHGSNSLMFIARQKNHKHYLHICVLKNGEVLGEYYLDGQEVIMLDIAIGKAINLLAPDIYYAQND